MSNCPFSSNTRGGGGGSCPARCRILTVRSISGSNRSDLSLPSVGPKSRCINSYRMFASVADIAGDSLSSNWSTRKALRTDLCNRSIFNSPGSNLAED